MPRWFCITIVAIALSLFSCSKSHFIPANIEGDCVKRAVETRQLLRSHGYQAEIVLGYIKEETEVKDAHAWIKYRKNKNNEWKRLNNL